MNLLVVLFTNNFMNCEPIFSCVMYWIVYFRLMWVICIIYIIFNACTSLWI